MSRLPRVLLGGFIPHPKSEHNKQMKKLLIPAATALSAMLLLTGCLGLQIGGGDKQEVQKATVGQQLIDLKTAQANGAITDAEYQAQKAKILDGK
jgi:hypothetical protein